MTGILRPESFVNLAFADEAPAEPRPKPWPKDPEAPPVIHHNTIAFAVSREMALDYGLVEPTPDEKADRLRRVAAYRVRKVAAWQLYDAALATFARITDPTIRAVLDHHAPQRAEYSEYKTECRGCDASGSDSETPDWPCSTVEVIAKAQGVALPAAWDLSLDYDSERGEWVRPE